MKSALCRNQANSAKKCADGNNAVRKKDRSNTHAAMKTKAVFFHAGCPVCVTAESQLAAALDPSRFELESVDLGQSKARVGEAEKAGVKSVPALVLDGTAFHINFGAALSALK